MRQGQQNRRGRGRGRKGQNPLARSYESNGPDVKVRGTAAHIAEKYMTLARDAISSGDTVLAENYLQHAEHYNRIIMAAQSAMPMQNGHNGQRMRPEGSDQTGAFGDAGEGMDDDFEESDGEQQLTGAMLAQEQPRMFDPIRPMQDRDRERHPGMTDQPRGHFPDPSEFDRQDRFQSGERPGQHGERGEFRGESRHEGRGDRGHQQRGGRHRRRFDNGRHDGGHRHQGGNGGSHQDAGGARESGSFDDSQRRRPPSTTTDRETGEDS